jgi:hypothetical protein
MTLTLLTSPFGGYAHLAALIERRNPHVTLEGRCTMEAAKREAAGVSASEAAKEAAKEASKTLS